MATTYGIIGGYTQVYLSHGWGIAFIVFGYNVFTKLNLMGNDPRCMIGEIQKELVTALEFCQYSESDQFKF